MSAMTAVGRWVIGVSTGVIAAVLCLVELDQLAYAPTGPGTRYLFLLAIGVAVGAARWSPATGLVAAWVVAATQLLGGVPALVTEASLLVVVFCAARWGRPLTAALAGLSAVLSPFVALICVRSYGYEMFFSGSLLARALGRAGYYDSASWIVPVGLAVLMIPFLAGLALRSFARAETAQQAQVVAEREAAAAQEVARVRDEQTRLARDVHDVVGHSLAVILAQAESAQYVDDADPGRLKQTLATIATSARTSLQDVRQVLSSTNGAPVVPGQLDTLIEGVRASGHDMRDTVIGQPRPLPPELDVVAYRVLQEMLTNAIRHGRRDQPVLVERRWPDPGAADDTLRIEVTNAVGGWHDGLRDSPTITIEPPIKQPGEMPGGTGQGLDGMRRRLASVGGSFAVRRGRSARDGTGGDGGADGGPETFTATAWVPVRPMTTGGQS